MGSRLRGNDGIKSFLFVYYSSRFKINLGKTLERRQYVFVRQAKVTPHKLYFQTAITM